MQINVTLVQKYNYALVTVKSSKTYYILLRAVLLLEDIN